MATSQLSQTAVGEALLSIALLPKRSQLTTSQTRTVVPDGSQAPRHGTNRTSAARTVPLGNSEAFAVSTPRPYREVAGQWRLSAPKSPGPGAGNRCGNSR